MSSYPIPGAGVPGTTLWFISAMSVSHSGDGRTFERRLVDRHEQFVSQLSRIRAVKVYFLLYRPSIGYVDHCWMTLVQWDEG